MSNIGTLEGYTKPRVLAPICMVLLSSGLMSVAVASDSSVGFEVAPNLAPSVLLPASMVSGTHFQVVEPVQSDGLMHVYTIDSKFGQFDAYGRAALEVRIHEIAALTEISKTSTIEVAAGCGGRGVGTQVPTAVGVGAHPVGTITGIAKGIAHLFHGYVDEGKEAVGKAQNVAAPTAGAAATRSTAVAQGEAGAERYARRYFRLTSAARQ